jgi:hypothetical protein
VINYIKNLYLGIEKKLLLFIDICYQSKREASIYNKSDLMNMAVIYKEPNYNTLWLMDYVANKILNYKILDNLNNEMYNVFRNNTMYNVFRNNKMYNVFRNNINKKNNVFNQGWNQFLGGMYKDKIYIKNIGLRKIRYYKNGNKYILYKGKKKKLNNNLLKYVK